MRIKIFFFVMIYCLYSFFVAGHTFASLNDTQEIILFSRYTENNWQIWAKNLDRGWEYQITHSKIDKKNPQWDSAGKQILFRTANSEIYTYNTKTRQEQKILHRFGVIMDQNYSESTKKLAFARLRPDLMDSSDVWISDISGENAKCLTNDKGLQYSPVFSKDGKKIAYISTNKQSGQTVYISDADAKNAQALTKGSFFDCFPAFSPSSRYIAFSSDRRGNYDIWRVEAATKKLMQLTTSQDIDTSPMFSPDGERIAFVSSRSGEMQIWIMNKDGENQTMSTQAKNTSNQDPLWIKIDKLTWQNLIKNKENE